MDTLTEGYFDTGEIAVHYMEGPRNGPPLLLQHGATGSWTNWNPVLPALTQRWHVYAADLRGHGKSGRPAGLDGYHITHHVQDMLAFLRGVVREPAVVVGHSYGAVTAMLAGKDAGEAVRALVLEDPPLLLGRDSLEDEGFSRYFRWLYDLRQTATTFEEVRAALAAGSPIQPDDEAMRDYAQNVTWLDPNFVLAITTGSRRETMRGVDYGAYQRGIRCPTLLMQASPEKGSPLPKQDVDFFLHNAPHARLARFPNSGHGIHQEQREAFLDTMEAFLKEAQILPA